MEMCRCVYPDKCFCPDEARQVLWATEEESREQFHTETISHEEHLYNEWCYEQAYYEQQAEDAWLRQAENTYYNEPDWAL